MDMLSIVAILSFLGGIVLTIVFVLLWKILLKATAKAYVEVEYLYTGVPKREIKRASYDQENGVLTFGGVKKQIVPVMADPISHNGKPLWRYVSPNPDVFVPVMPPTQAEVTITRKDKDGKEIEERVPALSLIPKLDFKPRAMYVISYKARERLYKAKNALREQLLKFGSIFLVVALVIIAIIFIYLMYTNMPAPHVTVSIANATKEMANGTALVPPAF